MNNKVTENQEFTVKNNELCGRKRKSQERERERERDQKCYRKTNVRDAIVPFRDRAPQQIFSQKRKRNRSRNSIIHITVGGT